MLVNIQFKSLGKLDANLFEKCRVIREKAVFS